MNDDVNTYLLGGSLGDLYFTTTKVQLVQVPTQQGKGGMTDTYLASGTYVKSFYTVMLLPSCVSVRHQRAMGGRWHHFVEWDYAVPKILSDEHRKPRKGVKRGRTQG